MDAPAHVLQRRFVDLPMVRLGPVAPWLGAFAIVVYLGLKGGGFDAEVQGEVGVVAWWAVLVASLTGLLPLTRYGRRAWIGIALLAAYLIWMALATGWSQSQEQGWADTAHVATLLGLFVLALAVQGREASRHFLNGLAAGVALVAVVALLSRLVPGWFPASGTAEFLPRTASRLSYPLNYWNALAALIAIGLPLVWNAASSARTVAMQALAAGALPAMALACYFTLSRGGALAVAIAVIVYLVLAPHVLARISTLVIAGAGSALLIAGASQRDALDKGLHNAAAHHQGHEMLAMVLIVCVGVGMLQAAIALALRSSALGTREPSLKLRALVVGALAVVCAVAVIGARHDLSQRWETFKNPSLGLTKGEARSSTRFQSFSGNGRYQYWSVAVRAGKSKPLKGIGAGGWELWWRQHPTISGRIRHAHSQVFQTFAELGIPGVALLVGLMLLALVSGVVRALTGPRRGIAAAATAGVAAFAVSIAGDWSWDVTVVPVVFLGLAAVLLAPAGPRARRIRERGVAALPLRIAAAVAAAVAIVGIALPLAGTSYIRDSRAHFNQGDFAAAMQDAKHAQDVQPYAADPALQQGLVLERVGRLREASAAVHGAISHEPTNAVLWATLSRIETRRGRAAAAVHAYREARRLDPESSLLRATSNQ